MKKYLKASLALVVAAIGLSSCLKEKPLFDPKNSSAVVELGDPSPISTFASTDYPYNVYNGSFDIVPSATYSIPVKYSGGPAPQDITVTLSLNNSIIDGYNTLNGYTTAGGDAYIPLTTSYYSVPSYTVTIPKGQTYALFNVSVKPDQFGFTQPFALGFSIKSTSLGAVSGNFGSALYLLAAKNKWDGVYSVNGTYKDLSFPAYSSVYPVTVELRTTGANTCAVYNQDYGLYGFLFNTGGGLSYYGNWAPIFTFDPSTNAVTAVTNYYGQGTNSSKRAGALDPSGTNKYDPSAKTIKVKYFMVQAGANRASFDETYTFTKVR